MTDPPSEPPTRRSSRNVHTNAAPPEPLASADQPRPAAGEVTVRVTVRVRSPE